MRDNKALNVTAGVVILGSALALAWSLGGGLGPEIDTGLYRVTGKVLARQAVSLLKPGGSLTVITRDTVAFQNPASDILYYSFHKELAKNGINVHSTQTLQIDPLRPMAVPAGDFFQWIKKAEKGSVIVSFMGPPVLSEGQITQLGEVQPGIVALCSGSVREQVDLRALFARGLLRAAVVSRRPIERAGSKPASDQELFRQQFVEVSAADLSGLAPGASKPSP